MLYFFSMARFPPPVPEYLNAFPIINCVFLSIMQCLHIYWFILFFKMLFHYRKTGDAVDQQNLVEDKKDVKTKKVD